MPMKKDFVLSIRSLVEKKDALQLLCEVHPYILNGRLPDHLFNIPDSDTHCR